MAGGGWADLPMDLLALIANHIEAPKDFIVFTCVCTSWQIAAHNHKFDVFFPQTPLLMLAHKNVDDYREFYSLSKQKVSSLFLPEARQRECCPTEGWLCTMDDSTGEMNLLHPLSRTQIQLPSRDDLIASNGLGDEVLWDWMVQAVLSASPSVTSDYVLVVKYHAAINRLAFWRPGDVNWTNIKMMDNLGAVMGINYYKGKFYYVTSGGGEFWVFEVPGPTTPKPIVVEPRLLYWCEDDILRLHSVHSYLVDLSDALLFITRFASYAESDRYKTYKFKVFEVDVIKGELKEEETKTLGDSAIFLGTDGACSVDTSKFPGIKPNHIYFIDDWCENFRGLDGGGRDMGVYNLEDGKIESVYPELSLSHICPPTWIMPSRLM